MTPIKSRYAGTIIRPVNHVDGNSQYYVIVHHIEGTEDTCIITPAFIGDTTRNIPKCGQVTNSAMFDTVNVRNDYNPVDCSWEVMDAMWADIANGVVKRDLNSDYTHDDPRNILVLGH